MAACLPPTRIHIHDHHRLFLNNPTTPYNRFFIRHHSATHILSLHPSFPNSWSGRCRVTPSPPESDPPKENDPTSSSSSGLPVSLSRYQDSVQIFFAVLFWMSLFFWASAWDGRNNGRPDKGSRFRG